LNSASAARQRHLQMN